MIHPFKNELNLKEMSNAAEPQTDRELLLGLHNKVNSMQSDFTGQVGRLADAVDKLGNTFSNFEEKRVRKLEERLDAYDSIRDKVSGAWVLIGVIWVLLTGGLVAVLKSIFW